MATVKEEKKIKEINGSKMKRHRERRYIKFASIK